MAAMYEQRSRLTPRQQSRLIEHFVVGSTARAASEIVGVQANTAIRFYMRLRHLIASKQPSYDLSGEVAADESYFGGILKGKRGRGAAEKVAVFRLLKSGGKVYTVIIPTCLQMGEIISTALRIFGTIAFSKLLKKFDF